MRMRLRLDKLKKLKRKSRDSVKNHAILASLFNHQLRKQDKPSYNCRVKRYWKLDSVNMYNRRLHITHHEADNRYKLVI